jgi:hypothetical protein
MTDISDPLYLLHTVIHAYENMKKFYDNRDILLMSTLSFVVMGSFLVLAQGEVQLLKTDKSSYFLDDNIIFSGTVESIDVGKQVYLEIINPQGNFVGLFSGVANSDDSYRITIGINSSQIQNKFSLKGTYNAIAFIQTRSSPSISFDYSPETPIVPHTFNTQSPPMQNQSKTTSSSTNTTTTKTPVTPLLPQSTTTLSSNLINKTAILHNEAFTDTAKQISLPGYNGTISTDKTSYNVGDVITISGKIHPVPSGALSIDIRADGDRAVYQPYITVNPDGTFLIKISTLDKPQSWSFGGEYKVYIDGLGGYQDRAYQISFIMNSYTPSALESKVKSDPMYGVNNPPTIPSNEKQPCDLIQMEGYARMGMNLQDYPCTPINKVENGVPMEYNSNLKAYIETDASYQNRVTQTIILYTSIPAIIITIIIIITVKLKKRNKSLNKQNQLGNQKTMPTTYSIINELQSYNLEHNIKDEYLDILKDKLDKEKTILDNDIQYLKIKYKEMVEKRKTNNSENNSLDVLKMRLAKGEISKEEFNDFKKLLDD